MCLLVCASRYSTIRMSENAFVWSFPRWNNSLPSSARMYVDRKACSDMIQPFPFGLKVVVAPSHVPEIKSSGEENNQEFLSYPNSPIPQTPSNLRQKQNSRVEKSRSESASSTVPADLASIELALNEAIQQQNFSKAAQLKDKMQLMQSRATVEVLQANIAYYNCFNSGSIEAMSEIWFDENDARFIYKQQTGFDYSDEFRDQQMSLIMQPFNALQEAATSAGADQQQEEKMAEIRKKYECSVNHPFMTITVGYDAVMETWNMIFSGSKVQIETSDVHVVAPGDDMAFVTCVENLSSVKKNGERLSGRVNATNVFFKVNGRWKMLQHHGSASMGK